jgi:ATP-dependent helicase/nuclease subunit B
VAHRPGFAEALASSIRELRASGVEPVSLGALGVRGSDLGALLAEYRIQLASAKLADATDVFTIAAESAKAESIGISALPLLLLDVPITSWAERQFIAAWMGNKRDVFATVVHGDSRTMSALLDLGAEHSTGAARTSTSLDRLQSFVFGSALESSYPEDGMVQYFSAPGEGRECIEIARRIHEAAATGTPFDQVAIALRSPQTYAPLLEAALERAGIPAYFARGTRRPDASGRALLALLLCAEERLSAKRFAEYLSLGQVPSVEDNGAPPIGRDIWVGANDEMLPGNLIPADEQVPPEPPPDRAEEQDPLVAGTLPLLFATSSPVR